MCDPNRSLTTHDRNLLRRGIFLLDSIVRYASGIREFTQDPDCVFRIAWSRAPSAHTFAGGAHVPAGAVVLELHFWNEHIPPMPPTGPDLSWAHAFYRRLRYSLMLLNTYLASHPRGHEVQALYGRIFLDIQQAEPGRRLLQRIGFELYPLPQPTAPLSRAGFFFVQGYAHALAWAYNPGSVHARSVFQKQITAVWMSRTSLAAHAPFSSTSSAKEDAT